MSLKSNRYSYLIAVVVVVLIAIAPTSLLRSEGTAWLKGLSILLAIYAILGAALGATWPSKGWQWGLWLVGPILVGSVLSLLFAGGVYGFLVKDVPLLTIIAFATCSGAFVGSRLNRRPGIV